VAVVVMIGVVVKNMICAYIHLVNKKKRAIKIITILKGIFSLFINILDDEEEKEK